MLIKNIHLENFKSIDVADIEFEKFTLVVGANAAGKSNIISAFRFISDILNRGIDNAISLQGGIEYLVNAGIAKGTPIKVSFEVSTDDEEWMRIMRQDNLGMQIMCLKYSFVIIPNKRASGYRIASDEMNIIYNCFTYNSKGKTEKERFISLNTSFSLILSRKNKEKNISINTKIDGVSEIIVNEKKHLELGLGAVIFADIMRYETKELMLYRASILLPPMFSENGFIRLFDFDPKSLKKSCSMSSIKTLEEDGSNIAAVLQSLLKDKNNSYELTKLLNNVLPFIERLSIENNFDQSFSYKIKEKYSKKVFHANFLSDGTVSIVAIILALYFEQQSNIIILEEPERNVHPLLLRRIIEMVKEVSENKQIIITTHNPEIIKHVQPKNLRFVSRDKTGFTKISNPENNDMVKCFIENELGLDDLFMQGLLG